MGRAILRVAPELLAEHFGKGCRACEAIDAPADMQIIGAHWDFTKSYGQILFLVESPDLADFPTGYVLPEITITYRDLPPRKQEVLDLAATIEEWAAAMWPEGECTSPTDEKGEQCPDD